MIARILGDGLDGRVVSRTKISDNDDLFAMVYFSALEVERLDLTMSWDVENRGAWSHDSDPWDFDLKPWVEKGKLRYCVPGEEPLRLGDTGCGRIPVSGRAWLSGSPLCPGGHKSGPHPFVPGHKITSAPMAAATEWPRIMVMADANWPIMSSPSKRTVTHNGTGHVALYEVLGIDWAQVYGELDEATGRWTANPNFCL